MILQKSSPGFKWAKTRVRTTEQQSTRTTSAVSQARVRGMLARLRRSSPFS